MDSLKEEVRDLVIYPHLNEIGQMIDSLPARGRCAIVAATGSGKSLGIPFHLAKSGKQIWISVPTIAAARSLYQRQIQLCRQSRLPVSVGYAAEGEKNYNKHTKIVYGTSGHWRRKFLSMHTGIDQWQIKSIPDIFILDEIHIGSMDNDILLSIFDLLPNTVKTKLVLATATYQAEKYPSIPVYPVEVKSFNIEEKYHHINYSLAAEKETYEDMIDKIIEIHNNDTNLILGDFLAFVAGSADVESIIYEIMTKVAIDNQIDPETITGDIVHNLQVLPAYSKLQREDLEKIYAKPPVGIRKIVIATNVAETSITIPGVGVVFDSMLEKTGGTSASGGKSLVTQKIFKDSANQRRGRTGRDREGICYRMCTEDHFETIPESRPPEIQRVPLHNMVLELLTSFFDPVKLLDKYVDHIRIKEAVDLLIRINVLTNTDNSQLPTINPIGHFICRFPLSVRNGAFLYHWTQAGNNWYHGIVIACLIECHGPSYIWWPDPKKVSIDKIQQFKQKMINKYGSDNELAICCRIWNRMMASVRGLWQPIYLIEKYCRDNSLNQKKIRELVMLVRQCMNDVNDSMTGFNENEYVNRAAQFLVNANPDKLYKEQFNRYISETGSIFQLDNKKTLSTVNSNTVLSLAEITLVLPYKTFQLITLWIPVIVQAPTGCKIKDSENNTENNIEKEIKMFFY